MNASFVRPLLTLVGVVLSTTSAHAVPYAATLLHPVGYTNSVANDVVGSIQFGTGRGGEHPSLDHALLWQGTSASVVDLHPAGFTQSLGLGASETQQVGYGKLANGFTSHALLWSGTPESAVDLHPTGYGISMATASSDNWQVGSGGISCCVALTFHALLWNGTPMSVVDLNPPGFRSSEANDISSTAQVGRGEPFSGDKHALLWHGTAASVVDLHPAGYGASTALAVSGDWQVGEARFVGRAHATLWHSTAESAIDLNPANSFDSTANDISLAGQVGTARFQNSFMHAAYWNGSAASAVDLHPFLSGLGINVRESIATGITDDGVIAGYATDASGNQYAVLWTPVPEPASCVLAIVLFAMVSTSRAAATGRSRGF